MIDYKKASDEELLRLVVRERRNENVVDDLLREFNTIDCIIATSTEEELLKIKNVGTIRAKQIKGIFELAYRLYTREYTDRRIIKSPYDAAIVVMADMRFLKKEYFKVILLNTKNQIIGVHDVSIGSLNSCIVHPREVFALAIKHSAAAIIIVHNHPSGNVSPSTEDISITRRLIEAGKVIGISVLDHVIVGYGTDRYCSLKEERHLD